jgi:starch-binding outer membrane protein SusE/F
MKTKLFLSTITILLCTFFGFSQTVSLTGAGVGGWNNPPLAQNLMTSTDGGITFTIANVQITGSGGSAELKFMVNSDWGTTYGYSAAPGWPSGIGAAPGTNIPGLAGFWNVTFNLNTKAYSFTPGVNPNPEIKLAGTSTNPASGLVLTTTNGVNYSLPSVTLTAGNAKFNQTSSTNSWGGTVFPSGTASTSIATAITIPAGTYNVSFNRTTGAYDFQTTAVGIVGDFNSWGNDEVFTTTNAVNYTKTGLVIAANGNVKFRDNANWTYGFGGSTNPAAFPSGTAASPGNDIPVIAGTYNVTFNRSTLAYSFQNVLSVGDFEKKSFKVYPNPASENWNFYSENEIIKSVTILDILGKTIVTKSNNSNELNINVTNLESGMYFAKITSDKGTESIKLGKN